MLRFEKITARKMSMNKSRFLHFQHTYLRSVKGDQLKKINAKITMRLVCTVPKKSFSIGQTILRYPITFFVSRTYLCGLQKITVVSYIPKKKATIYVNIQVQKTP